LTAFNKKQLIAYTRSLYITLSISLKPLKYNSRLSKSQTDRANRLETKSR